jgi:hypothetical protein
MLPILQPVTGVNTKLVSPTEATNAGLDRYHHPGAGAITHFYGIETISVDTIVAGSGECESYFHHFLSRQKCFLGWILKCTDR